MSRYLSVCEQIYTHTKYQPNTQLYGCLWSNQNTSNLSQILWSTCGPIYRSSPNKDGAIKFLWSLINENVLRIVDQIKMCQHSQQKSLVFCSKGKNACNNKGRILSLYQYLKVVSCTLKVDACKMKDAGPNKGGNSCIIKC